MQSVPRPSAVLALVLATVSAQGCLFGCGDLSFEHREVDGHFVLDAQGRVETYAAGSVDPTTRDGCEALCHDASYAQITRVESCDLTIRPGVGDTDDTDADTDPPALTYADTGAPSEFGTAHVRCVTSGTDMCKGGRHHADLLGTNRGRGPDATAAWLAREATAEAGSVLAFRRLAAELVSHGAPGALVDRARAAARDEVRHARAVRRLAAARGGVCERVRARRPSARSLLELARENAVEGCVHETFAAARAAWQAEHATDASVRRVACGLAQDEAGHADLAADLHAWALSVLAPEQAAEVEAARVGAWRRLVDAPPHEPDVDAVAVGVPTRDTAGRLALALARGLGVALA